MTACDDGMEGGSCLWGLCRGAPGGGFRCVSTMYFAFAHRLSSRLLALKW